MEPLRQLAAAAIVVFARAITAVRGNWAGEGPSIRQRVYFANHASHGDFILIWTVLPPRLRRRTRPVAAADYWLKSRLRAFIGREVFNAVLIDRDRQTRQRDPVAVIDGVIAHRARREAKVLAVLSGAGRGSLDELLPQVYDDVRPELLPIARHSLEAHLIKLGREGRARLEQNEWRAPDGAVVSPADPE